MAHVGLVRMILAVVSDDLGSENTVDFPFGEVHRRHDRVNLKVTNVPSDGMVIRSRRGTCMRVSFLFFVLSFSSTWSLSSPFRPNGRVPEALSERWLREKIRGIGAGMIESEKDALKQGGALDGWVLRQGSNLQRLFLRKNNLPLIYKAK